MSPSIITHPQSAGYRPPIVSELEAMFRILPDNELLARLQGPRRRGRPGYDPAVLWRCYVTYYALGLVSVSDLIRLLHDNPFIAAACGIDSASQVPSQPTLSRFGAKLARPSFTLQLKNIMRALTRSMYNPEYVICDAGYSSNKLRKVIKRQYRAVAIIDPNPAHKSAMKLERVPEWKSVYNRRTAIERLNGRLKAFRKLNDVRVRGRFKVRVHAMLSVIMLQARALAFPDQLRRCVRAVASPNP